MSADTFNASVYLIDRQVEAGLGGHLAVTGPAGSLTYAELAARTAELASGFRASGVRPEERVLAPDVLPKTATGKIQRVVVREVVAQRLGKPEE